MHCFLKTAFVFVTFANLSILSEARVAMAPEITSLFGGGFATEGGIRTLGVSAEGSPPLTYQWFKEGEELADETGAKLDFATSATTDTGNYRVEVSNAYGSASSPVLPLLVFSSSPAGGQRDEGLSGRVNGVVTALAEEADGSVLVGGDFDHYRGKPRPYLFRIFPNNEVDPGFSPGLPGRVTALAVQPNGHLLVAGARWILRMSPAGEVDPTFYYGGMRSDFEIGSLAVQPSGKILVAGSFKYFDGSYTGPLVQLWPNGTFRQAVGRCIEDDPMRSCLVSRVHVEPDGSFLSQTRMAFDIRPSRFIDRHRSVGQVDETFSYTPLSPFGPTGVLPQVVEGKRVGYWLLDSDDTTIQRLHSNGERDPAYGVIALRGSVGYYAPGRDGRFYIDANFWGPWGMGEKGPFRINSEGRFDTNFRNNEDFAGLLTLAMLEQLNGDLLVAGSFPHGPNPMRLKGGDVAYDDGYTAWAQTHGLGDAGEDFGGHGIVNLLRFALGLDPHNPPRELLPSIVLAEDEHGGSPAQFLSLTYRRNLSAAGVVPLVQGSNDLISWHTLTQQIGYEVDQADPAIAWITVRDDIPIQLTDGRFLRLYLEVVHN